MNRNQLKYLVILAMLIDHIAWAFVPTASPAGQLMHLVGRLTAPTMAYFIAEGYRHTQNVKKYVLRLALFALLSWAPFVYFEFGYFPIHIGKDGFFIQPATGVIYTLLLGLLAICLWDRTKWPKWCKVLLTILLCAVSVIGDWAMFTVLWCLFFYLYRDDPRKKWLAFSIVGLFSCLPALFSEFWWSGLYNFGIFLVPFPIQFGYNGQPGSRRSFHKWFFYIFYPAHLLVLGLLKWAL